MRSKFQATEYVHSNFQLAVLLEVCRLASAGSAVRSVSDEAQPSTAEAGSVGGTSVFGQESFTPAKPGIFSRPAPGSGTGKSYNPQVPSRVS